MRISQSFILVLVCAAASACGGGGGGSGSAVATMSPSAPVPTSLADGSEPMHLVDPDPGPAPALPPAMAGAFVEPVILPYTSAFPHQVVRGHANRSHTDYGGEVSDDLCAIDFAMPGCLGFQAPIVAPISGQITIRTGALYGESLLITRSDGLIVRLAHCDRLLVRDGDMVTQGSVVALEGNSGSVSGSSCPSHPGTHIHMATYKYGHAAFIREISGIVGVEGKEDFIVPAPQSTSRVITYPEYRNFPPNTPQSIKADSIAAIDMQTIALVRPQTIGALSDLVKLDLVTGFLSLLDTDIPALAGITVANGKLYAASKGGQVIYSYDLALTAPLSRTIVAGSGTSNPSILGDGGPALSADLIAPADVLLVGQDLYIAEAGRHRIRRVQSNGLISTLAGTGVPGSSGDGGLATSAQLDNPSALQFDQSTNSLIVLEAGSRLRKINLSSGLIESIVISPGPNAFSDASDFILDGKGQIIIAEPNKNRLLSLPLSGGSAVIFAGITGPATGVPSGIPNQSPLFQPRGLTLLDHLTLVITESFIPRLVPL